MGEHLFIHIENSSAQSRLICFCNKPRFLEIFIMVTWARTMKYLVRDLNWLGWVLQSDQPRVLQADTVSVSNTDTWLAKMDDSDSTAGVVHIRAWHISVSRNLPTAYLRLLRHAELTTTPWLACYGIWPNLLDWLKLCTSPKTIYC